MAEFLGEGLTYDDVLLVPQLGSALPRDVDISTRFCRGVPAKQKMLEDVMVRRLKDDIRSIQGGFAIRKVVQIDIDGLPPTAPELQLSSLLDEYRTERPGSGHLAPLTVVGRLEAGEPGQVFVQDEHGRPIAPPRSSWDHFRSGGSEP